MKLNKDSGGSSPLFKLTLALLLCFSLTGCDEPEQHLQHEDMNNATRYNATIIAVGDSLTAGFGVAEDDAWPALLELKLGANGHKWQVINAGISGETSSGTLSRIQWIVAQKPQIVILETGANDGFRGIPINTIRDNISQAVGILQEAGVTVVLAGMQIVQNLGPDYSSAFASIYPEIAEEHGCLLIPFILERVATIPTLNQADMIHPNEAGYKLITETVYPYVLEAIALQSVAPDRS